MTEQEKQETNTLTDEEKQQDAPAGTDMSAELAPVSPQDVHLTEAQLEKIEDHPKGDEEYLEVPRGTLAFVIALIVFYVVYWIITYFEVFVLRGA